MNFFAFSGENSDKVRLTTKLKLVNPPDFTELFKIYRSMVNRLIKYALKHGDANFYRLKRENYHELRKKYPSMPSHYVHTACQLASAIMTDYFARKAQGKAKKRPQFRANSILLDDHLFKVDFENNTVRLLTNNGPVLLEFSPTKHLQKFLNGDWKLGQAFLVKKDEDVFVNVVFTKDLKIREPKTFVGVDLNENNVTLSLPNGEFVQIITHEREIRTGYFVKRRKIQKRLRAGKKRRELLAKYGKRERYRIIDIYHKIANKIVELAEKYNAGIALEDLTEIRDSIRYSAEMNGRLHRWSFRKLQSIIEYKAKLKGIKVVFVNPAHTSSLCPVCGGKLSPNGHGVLKCSNCGFEADRDAVGSLNIRLRALKMWGVSVPPESPTMKMGVGKPRRAERVCVCCLWPRSGACSSNS
ncbi:transposase [Thermococcus sp. M39]|nr:transposase [Thermococcus sp. M39]